MSKKRTIAYTTFIISASFLAGYIIAVHDPTTNAALILGNENNQQCQYPSRPLVNGECDNSDPALPEPTPVTNEINTNTEKLKAEEDVRFCK
jgi:hypothetical protein